MGGSSLSPLALSLLVVAESVLGQYSGLNVRVNQDATSQPQNEGWVRINRTNPQSLAAVANNYRLGQVYPGYYFCTDGGLIWQDGSTTLCMTETGVANPSNVTGSQCPSPPPWDYGGDPCVGFDPLGQALFTYNYYKGIPSITDAAIFIARSPAGPNPGSTYPAVAGFQKHALVARAGPASGQYVDKPLFDIDATPGPGPQFRHHVAYSLIGSTGWSIYCQSADWGTAGAPSPLHPGPNSIPPVYPGGILVSNSPLNLPFNIGAAVAVAPNGDVYVAWLSIPATGDGGQIMVDRSVSRGLFWDQIPPAPGAGDVVVRIIPNRVRTVAAAGCAAPQRLLASSMPAIAVHPGNPELVAVVWAEQACSPLPCQSDSDIFLSVSQMGGMAGSWSAPIRVNQDTLAGYDQFFPSVSIDPFGQIHVTYYDRRRIAGEAEANKFMHLTYARTPDLGATWIEQRVTLYRSSPCVTLRQRLTGYLFFGDYIPVLYLKGTGKPGAFFTSDTVVALHAHREELLEGSRNWIRTDGPAPFPGVR